MNLEPQECYRLYLAIKAHFDSNYDYFKYNGKIRTGDFNARKDKFSFYKIARKYDNEEIIDFFVSNCVYLPKKDFLPKVLTNSYSDTIYKEYKERKANFAEHFERELTNLVSSDPQFLKIDDGHIPYILKAVITKGVSYETFIALDEFLHFIKDFDVKLGDDLFWPEIRAKCKNFHPFVWFKHHELKPILKRCMTAMADVK